AALICAGSPLLAAEPAPPRLPPFQLRLFRGPDGSLQPVQSPADWQQRRAEIVRAMHAVMGDFPPAERHQPPPVEVVSEVDCGSYVRRWIRYQTTPGTPVPAYLCIPKRLLAEPGLKAPAALCLHGTDDVVGAGTVVGLGSRPNRQYAAELAERGWVTLAPNYPHLAGYRPPLESAGWASGTLKAIDDNRRGLDLLDSLPFVRTGKYAAIGHSLGGHNAVYTAVLDDRLIATVSSCGLDSYPDYYGGKEANWQPGRGWTQPRYMPRLASYRGRLAEIPFDFPELIAALAPRRMLIIAPLRDHNFRADSVDRLVAAAQPIFELHQLPGHLRVEHPDCEHDFPPEMRRLAYEFLEQALPITPASP
ncbi:MAG: dienelactone hydrolase family protein, partial [Planctomycetaceae bacterium]